MKVCVHLIVCALGVLCLGMKSESLLFCVYLFWMIMLPTFIIDPEEPYTLIDQLHHLLKLMPELAQRDGSVQFFFGYH